jgi:hypothetical protein
MEKVSNICDRLATTFGFSLTYAIISANTSSTKASSANRRRWFEAPRCRDHYFKGYCPGRHHPNPNKCCKLDHTSRCNEPYQRFRVDVDKCEPSDKRGLIDIYYGFGMSLVCERLNHKIEFSTDEYVILVTFFEALCVLIEKEAVYLDPRRHSTADVAKKEDTCVFLIRFVRELFPLTLKFLQSVLLTTEGDPVSYLPPEIIQRMAHPTTKIETIIAVTTANWTSYEQARMSAYTNSLLMLTSDTNNSSSSLVHELTRSALAYASDQALTNATRSVLHSQIITDLSFLLSDTIPNALQPNSSGRATGNIKSSASGGGSADIQFEFEVFGSAANTFGSSNSDVDMSLRVLSKQEDNSYNKMNLSDASTEKLLVAMSQRITAVHQSQSAWPLRDFSFELDELVIDARVPVLKLLCRPRTAAIDTENGPVIHVDVCLDNENAMMNTRLLRSYAEYDERVRPLVMAVKLWASKHGLNVPKHGTLTSYAWTLLVIHFLQCGVFPPVLPSLQVTKQDEKSKMLKANTSSVGELYLQFFHYYGNVCLTNDYEAGSRTHKCYNAASSETDNGNSSGAFYYPHHDFYVQVADISHGCSYTKSCALDFVTFRKERKENPNNKKTSTRRDRRRKNSEDAEAAEPMDDDVDVDTAAAEAEVEVGIDTDALEIMAGTTNEGDAAAAVVLCDVVDAEVAGKSSFKSQSKTGLSSTRIVDSEPPPAAKNAVRCWRVCIQDPYEEVDLGRVVWHPSSMLYIIKEFRRVAEIVMREATHSSAGSDMVTKFSKLSVQSSMTSSSGGFSSESGGIFQEITAGHSSPLAIPFYCLLCGDMNHQTRSCPLTECSICFKLGHTGRECDRIQCSKCREKGHFKRDCPNNLVVEDTEKPKERRGDRQNNQKKDESKASANSSSNADKIQAGQQDEVASKPTRRERREKRQVENSAEANENKAVAENRAPVSIFKLDAKGAVSTAPPSENKSDDQKPTRRERRQQYQGDKATKGGIEQATTAAGAKAAVSIFRLQTKDGSQHATTLSDTRNAGGVATLQAELPTQRSQPKQPRKQQVQSQSQSHIESANVKAAAVLDKPLAVTSQSTVTNARQTDAEAPDGGAGSSNKGQRPGKRIRAKQREEAAKSAAIEQPSVTLSTGFISAATEVVSHADASKRIRPKQREPATKSAATERFVEVSTGFVMASVQAGPPGETGSGSKRPSHRPRHGRNNSSGGTSAEVQQERGATA